jgi:hypothetical protein
VTEWYPDEQLRELATLPPTAAARKTLESRLLSANAVERQFWTEYMNQTDRLYAVLGNVSMPAGLEQRLLQIVETEEPVAKAMARPEQKARGWRWIAAAAAVALAVGLRFYMLPAPPQQQPQPTPVPALDPQVAELLSKQAIACDEASPTFEVTDSDAGKVKAALDARKLPFDVMVLHPTGQVQLVGGGVCDFHGTPAAFTHWQSNGANYTVYQLDGTSLGAPDRFQTTTETPTELWHGDLHYHIVIWPGQVGKCTWVSVVDRDGAQDWFSGTYY